MRKPICPKCNSENTCPIFYGYPADIEAYLEAEAEKWGQIEILEWILSS